MRPLLSPTHNPVLLLLSATLIAFGPIRASAIECGDVLTEDTLLDSDLHCSGDGLVIGAHSVIVDLGGHALEGSGVSGTVGIRNDGYDRVLLRNGSVRRFDVGVLLDRQSSWNRLSDLVVEFNNRQGISVVNADRNRLEGNTLRGNEEGQDCGVDKSCADLLLLNSHHNRVVANRISFHEFGGLGIHLIRSDHNRLIENRFSAGFSPDMVLEASHHNQILANAFGFGDSNALTLDHSERNLVVDNVLGTETGNAAMLVHAHRNRIVRNTIVSTTGGDGLVLMESDENRIESNELDGTSRGHGLNLVSGERNWILGNVASRNGTRSIPLDDGIFVGAEARDTRIKGNLAQQNGDDGIDVEDSSAVLVENVAEENGDYGIEAVPGVRARRNSASGNGNPDQCLNVECDAP